MKIKILSKYDVAKNLLNIINNTKTYNKNTSETALHIANTDIPQYKKQNLQTDTFRKQSKKEVE